MNPRPETPVNFNLIGGELRHWPGETIAVTSPVDGELLGSYPKSDRDTALAALAAASAAWDRGRGSWPTATAPVRVVALRRLRERMAEHRDELARLIVWEIAKTVADARKEVERTLAYIDDTLDAVSELHAQAAVEGHDGIDALVRRAPLGVVLCMGPFNYPLNETLCTLIPALAMGNCCVVKPPRYGALMYGLMARLCAETLPPGVINIVFGEGRTVASSIMADGRVDALAFIGSSRSANDLLRQHPRPNRLRPILGLEAKNPAIVTAHADLDLAAAQIVAGAFSYNGQRCTAIKEVLAARSIAPALEERLTRLVAALPCGAPDDPLIRITPLVEPGKPQQLLAMIDEAVAGGARLLTGGMVCGQLMSPALVADVPRECALWQDEQFGPVLPLATYDDIEEVFDQLAASNYGQQAALFTSDPDEAAELVDQLANQVCRINLNTQCQRGPDILPFTGRKDSAVGTLSVSDALRCFSIRTLVAEQGGRLMHQLRGRARFFELETFDFHLGEED